MFLAEVMADEDIQGIQYDEARDTCICPEGKELQRWAVQQREGKPPLIVYRGESCRECPVRKRCTAGKACTVSRDRRESLMEAMREKAERRRGKTDLYPAGIHGGAGFRGYKME